MKDEDASVKDVSVFNQNWYIVGQPWGNGHWIVAGDPDPHKGTFVCDCDGMSDESDEEVLARAQWIVQIHNEWKFRKEALLREIQERDAQIAAVAEEIDRLRQKNQAMQQALAALPDWYRRLGTVVFGSTRAFTGWYRRVREALNEAIRVKSQV